MNLPLSSLFNTPLRIVFLLSIAGFFLEFKPSEPYLTKYLKYVKGFNDDQLDLDIYPIYTYAYFAFILPSGFLSEIIGYKSIVLLGVILREMTRLILLYSDCMQMTQVTFGFAQATMIVYYSYIYLLVPKEHYLQATALIRSLPLFGHVCAGVTGQLLYNAGYSLTLLMYLSFFSVTVGVFIFIYISLLPPLINTNELELVSEDVQYKTLENNINSEYDIKNETLFSLILKKGFNFTLSILMNQYFTGSVLLWSLWWVFGESNLEIVLNYNTVLFEEVDPTVNYNGAVMAVARCMAALAAIIPRYAPKLKEYSWVYISTFTLIAALMNWLSYFTTSIYFCYIAFIVYYALMEFLVSASSAGIASEMTTSYFGLVFCFNTFWNCLIQVVLQAIMEGDLLTIYEQYLIFAIQLTITGFFFMIFGKCLILNNNN